MPIDAAVYGLQRPPQIDTPFQGLSQMLQLRTQQQTAAALEQERQARATEIQQQTLTAQQAQAHNAAFAHALQQGKGVRGATLDLLTQTDPGAVPQATKYFDDAELRATEIQQKKADLQKAQSSLNDLYLNHIGRAANEALEYAGDDPSKLPGAITIMGAHYAEQFPDEKDRAQQQVQQLLQLPPDQQRAALVGMREHAPYWQAQQAELNKPREVPQGGAIMTGTGQVLAHNAPKQTFEQKPVLWNGKESLANFDPLTGKTTDPATGRDISGEVKPMPPAAMRVSIGGIGQGPQTFDASRPDPATGNKVDPATGYTPNALYQNAVTFALENKMPSMGMGSNPQVRAARSAIQNKAGAIAAAAGVDLPTLQAEYRANSTTLNKLMPQAQATANAANTAKDNLQLALNQSPAVTRTDSAWVNSVVNKFVAGATSAVNLTKFETYIYTAAREYAKVTSGGAGSVHGLSDTAAREASKLLNAAQSKDAFAAAIQAMQDDMDNVLKGQSEGLKGVSNTIANFFSAANGTPLGSGTQQNAKDPMGIRK